MNNVLQALVDFIDAGVKGTPTTFDDIIWGFARPYVLQLLHLNLPLPVATVRNLEALHSQAQAGIAPGTILAFIMALLQALAPFLLPAPTPTK